MSIIYEALKKAETKESFKKPQYAKSNSKGLFLLFAGIIGVAVFIIAFKNAAKLNRPIGAGHLSKSPSAVSGASLEKNIRGKEKNRKKKEVNKKQNVSYCLQGIIYDEFKPLAIINGKKVEVGQEIEQALLTQISDKGIQIETEDGVVSIPLD